MADQPKPNYRYWDQSNTTGDASDAADGRLKSEGGTGPWLSESRIRRAFENREIPAGSGLYMLPSIVPYVFQTGFVIECDGIEWFALPGHEDDVTVSVSFVENHIGDQAMRMGGMAMGPIQINARDVSVGNFRLQYDGQVFGAGDGFGGRSRPCRGSKLIGIRGEYSGQGWIAGNGGIVKLNGPNANGMSIIGCDFEQEFFGRNGLNNAGLIYVVNLDSVEIAYNRLRSYANAAQGGATFHHKKGGGNPSIEVGQGIHLHHNIIQAEQPGRRLYHGNMARALIEDNILICTRADGGSMQSIKSDGGSGVFSDGYQVVHRRNLWRSPRGNLSVLVGGSDFGNRAIGEPFTEQEHTGSIFDNVWLNIWSGRSGAHRTILDRNLYPRRGIVAVERSRSFGSLSAFRKSTDDFMNGSHDGASREGEPVYESGEPDFQDAKSFRQVAGSIGDGLGPDVDRVGPEGMRS